jgi:hypothetical protein
MTATSYQVRTELEELLERDLLGPWDGPDEELPPGTAPAERYLLGRLVPSAPQAGAAPAPDVLDADPETVDREVLLTDDIDDPDVEPEATVRAGSMAAASLGLAFAVSDDIDEITVAARWGRYERTASAVHRTEQDRPRQVWKRFPAGGEVDVPLGKQDDLQLVPDPAREQVMLRVAVRHRGRRRIVEAALVNAQPAPSGSHDTARLYQVSLTVTALDGQRAVFLGHNDPELGERPRDRDDERLHLMLLHRHSREYAHGRQCAVDADVREGEMRAWRLRTTSFPSADVPLVVPGDSSRTMPGLVLDMARLGSPELARDELVRALRPLVTGYRAWLDREEPRLTADPEVAAYAPAGEHALAAARDLADRLDRAVDLLRDDGRAREAFRFANQAMALQRVRSELVRARLIDPDRSVGELLRGLDKPETRSWRPFQLAFMLLCLPGLTDPSHPDAHRGVDDGQVQLLFFPTGGGKTEAYLGLIAYTLAIRRLQGVVGTGDEARNGTDGVAAVMRYTLRLLTAQQFQRAAALVCACERLRHERLSNGDGRWGTTPFRLGLWVGASVTPNSYEEARRQVTDAQGQEGSLGGPLQLAACPWCGSGLSGRDLSSHDLRRRVLLHCSDPEGDCPFSRRQSPDEGLPVLTVDEEIYRLTPALVIGTVDKFAQLPWKAATSTLFGLVDERCARHGWRNPDFDGFCRSRHPRTGALPAAVPEPALRLRPPDLVIQDELHLISDALGSLVGLFETVVDRLASRTTDGRVVRPVLVASTATVRRAADQVEQVFARGLAVFPPQVIDAGETFYSTTVPPSPEFPGRRYRGICAPGERLKSVEIRVVTELLEHAQHLFDRHGEAADPYMTLVDYFTSTRELAGMRRLVDDDVTDRLKSRQVRTKRVQPMVSELTSRMPSRRIGTTLADLERPFDPSLHSTAALDEFKRDRDARSRPGGRYRPLDVLLATSMLQVGVDVPRLGLMVVTGQPKNTAEYIQATSRVGRDRRRPGLVLTIYHWSRPRDLAHYEGFAYDHATFGMRVEGLTTTPFSDRALDRGLSAVLVAALRHASMDALPNVAAQRIPLSGPVAAEILDAVQQRAERVLHDREAAEGVRGDVQHRLDRWYQRRTTLAAGRLGYEEAADVTGLLRNPEEGGWDLWSTPRSLREVEPEVLLQLERRDLSLDETPVWEYQSAPEGTS